MNDALIVLGAYLLGSVSFAVVISRLFAGPKILLASVSSADEIGVCQVCTGQSHSSATAATGLTTTFSF